MTEEQAPLPDLIPNPYNKPESCLGCSLYSAPGRVEGFGPRPAKLMFVGEAPGHDEVTHTHRPFTGGSGRVLTALCASVGIKRNETYITNVVKCRPSTTDAVGDVKDRAPTKEEMRHCAPNLAKEIEEVHPNLIVALGASALYVFKDRDDIGKRRGQAFLQGTQKVLATYHPAALMRQQRMFPLVVEDLRRAVEEAKTPTLNRLSVEYVTFGPGGGDLERLKLAVLDAGYLVEDLETTHGPINQGPAAYARQSTILCCGFGTEPRKADVYTWSDSVAEFVRWAHNDPRVEVVGQNVESFDFPYLEEKNVPYPSYRRFDTLLAFHLISPDLPKDLGTQGSVYTDREYWKDKGKNSKSLQDTMEYCAEDIDGTCRAYLEQKKELKYLGLEELYYNSVMPLQPVLRHMTKRGMRKNEEIATKWSMAMNMTADRKEDTLRKGLGDPYFSVNSPKQVMDLLYNKLGLPVQYTRDKTRGMRPTANAEAIETLANVTDDPIFHLFNEIRTLRKWASTYCDIPTDEFSFIHPEFGSAKAANGRLNSWNPNAQNIPVELREFLEADTLDHVIVSADWSQVEWRIEMALSGDELGMEMYSSEKDIHKMAAVGFTGVRYEEVSKPQRHQMKFVVYGLLYGRSAGSIAKQIGSTKEEVEKMIKGFFKVFKGVEHHLEAIVRLVGKQQYLRNPFSRRRWWYTRMITEVYNFLPSSTAADMMYLVLPKLEAQLPTGSTLRLTVHDEVDIVSPKDQKTLTQTIECVKDLMQVKWPAVVENSLRPDIVKKFYPDGWWVPVDVSLGNNWKQCKPQTGEEEEWQKSFQKTLGVTA